MNAIIAAQAKERMLSGKANPPPILAEGKGETRDELARLADAEVIRRISWNIGDGDDDEAQEAEREDA